MKKFPNKQNILCGNLSNIVQFYSFLTQAEIKKKYYIQPDDITP